MILLFILSIFSESYYFEGYSNVGLVKYNFSYDNENNDAETVSVNMKIIIYSNFDEKKELICFTKQKLDNIDLNNNYYQIDFWKNLFKDSTYTCLKRTNPLRLIHRLVPINENNAIAFEDIKFLNNSLDLGFLPGTIEKNETKETQETQETELTQN